MAASIKCCLAALFWFQETNRKIKSRCESFVFLPAVVSWSESLLPGRPARADRLQDRPEEGQGAAAQAQGCQAGTHHLQPGKLQCFSSAGLLAGDKAHDGIALHKYNSQILQNWVIQIKKLLTALTEVSVSSYWKWPNHHLFLVPK